jgi:HlyD family secretion protein
MFTENAATKRQVDEVEGKVNVYKNRLRVWKLKMHQSNEAKSIDVQIAKINDQIEKSKIPTIKGTVLAKYAEPNEITAFGKPLYKIADISEMTLRIYVAKPSCLK